MYTKLLNHDILSFIFCIFSNIYCSSLHINMKNKTMAKLSQVHNCAYTWAMGHVVVEILWIMHEFLL